MVACAHPDGPRNSGSSHSGTLAGAVTRGPTAPVSGPGRPAAPARAVAGAELKILNPKGAVVATARTGGDGLYQIALPPGEYRVERGNGFDGPARNLPARVAISPGQRTRLDVWVDSGIRGSAHAAEPR